MGPSEQSGAVAGTMAKLKRAREFLDGKNLAGALEIYEEVLVSSGDRADVLVVVSGDLGSTGHVSQVIELVAPRYDARRHGPATGVNLLQAYIAVRNPGAAQHMLDLLFDQKRPDLEERLFGFSNAISELLLSDTDGMGEVMTAPPGEPGPANASKIGVVTISKPIWIYGIETLADRILPQKQEGKGRRVAFAQLALPGTQGAGDEAIARNDSEIALLAGAIPTWFAEIFAAAPTYTPYTAVAFVERPDGTRHPMVFGVEWTTENLKNLVDTTTGGLDYAVTGALRHRSGDYELTLRVWEVKKFRERKQFVARWSPASADVELAKLRDQVCHYMEWTTTGSTGGLAYAPLPAPRAWLDVLGSSLNLFLAEKTILPPEWVPPLAPAHAALVKLAPQSPAASLAWLTLKDRAQRLGVALPGSEPALSPHPLVAEAAAVLAQHAPGHG